jgi:hypothetical protein
LGLREALLSPQALDLLVIERHEERS